MTDIIGPLPGAPAFMHVSIGDAFMDGDAVWKKTTKTHAVEAGNTVAFAFWDQHPVTLLTRTGSYDATNDGRVSYESLAIGNSGRPWRFFVWAEHPRFLNIRTSSGQHLRQDSFLESSSPETEVREVAADVVVHAHPEDRWGGIRLEANGSIRFIAGALCNADELDSCIATLVGLRAAARKQAGL